MNNNGRTGRDELPTDWAEVMRIQALGQAEIDKMLKKVSPDTRKAYEMGKKALDRADDLSEDALESKLTLFFTTVLGPLESEYLEGMKKEKGDTEKDD